MKSKRQTEKTTKGIQIRAVFSSNLRRLRKNAQLSQISLAAKAGLAPNFINDIENGKKWVSPESLGKLAIALEAEPYQFFITSPKWDVQGKEFLSLLLSDIERVSSDYRKRFFFENTEEDELAD